MWGGKSGINVFLEMNLAFNIRKFFPQCESHDRLYRGYFHDCGSFNADQPITPRESFLEGEP